MFTQDRLRAARPSLPQFHARHSLPLRVSPAQVREMKRNYAEKYPAIAACPRTIDWLIYRDNLGDDHKTLDAYAAGLSDFLVHLAGECIPPLEAKRDVAASWIKIDGGASV